MCRFLPVTVSLPVKNKAAGTKYRLKLSALCDLLEILCTLGLKQVEAPAKQDRFRCGSASKTMNAQSHQKPCVSHAKVTPPPSPLRLLVPSSNGQVPSYRTIIVQELCESRGGRPGLSVLTSLLVFVDVKIY